MYCRKHRMLYSFAVLAVYLLCCSGCAGSTTTALKNYFNSLDHFTPYKNDARVLYEPGAEAFAAAVAERLPSAVHKVETRQYSEFPEHIEIYVFKSHDSFKKIIGRDVRGVCYRKRVFLSPEFLEEEDQLGAYLAHELSHLHLVQYLGEFGRFGIPMWFTEGLATYVSDGGGAQHVTHAEVKESIQSGNHFLPSEKAGITELMRPKNAGYYGIEHPNKHHLFYGQCMLFVAFLEKKNPVQFENFLNRLKDGAKFSRTFQSSFYTDTISIWEEFKEKIGNTDCPVYQTTGSG